MMVTGYKKRINFFYRLLANSSEIISIFFFYFPELKANVKTLEEWLKEVENVLKQPLNFSQKWTQQAIDDKMQEIKVRKR